MGAATVAMCQTMPSSTMHPSRAAGRLVGAPGAEAGEEGGGGFVGRVFGDGEAGEGFVQERLPQGPAPPQRGVDLPLVPNRRTLSCLAQPHG